MTSIITAKYAGVGKIYIYKKSDPPAIASNYFI